MKKETIFAALISVALPLATACARDIVGDLEKTATVAQTFTRQENTYRLAKQLEKDHAGIYEECEYSYKMLPEEYVALSHKIGFESLFAVVTSKTDTAIELSRRYMSEADEAAAKAMLTEGRLSLNKVRDAIRPFKHLIPEIIWEKQHPARFGLTGDSR